MASRGLYGVGATSFSAVAIADLDDDLVLELAVGPQIERR